MSKRSAEILDYWRDKYPEPEYDWRYRSGRMAEALAELEQKFLAVSIQVTQASPEDARSRQVVAGSAQAEGGEQPEQGGQPIKTRHCLTTGPAPDVASKARKGHGLPVRNKDGYASCPDCGEQLPEATDGGVYTDLSACPGKRTQTGVQVTHPVCEPGTHRFTCHRCGIEPPVSVCSIHQVHAESAPADSIFVEGLKTEIKQQRQWKYEIAADKNRLEKVIESFLREAGRGNLSHCNGQAAIDEMIAEAKKALKFCTSCDGSGKETEVSRPVTGPTKGERS